MPHPSVRDSAHHGPLRVAVVSPVWSPSVGGAERTHRLVAQALARQARVEVFTPALPGAEPPHSELPPAPGGNLAPTVVRLPGIQVLGERVIRPGSLWTALWGFRPDVVWSHAPSVAGDVAGFYARVAGVPWLALYHGDPQRTRPYAGAYVRFESRWLAAADGVFVHTERYRDRLHERGVHGPRILLARPGPGLGDGTAPSGGAPLRGGEPGADHPFLFVGGLDAARAYKRPESLLRALAELRRRRGSVFAWFVGDGARRHDLEQLARELGVASEVCFLGRLDDGELARRLGQAWALVLPSDSSEGFGLAVIEAAQFGCPSVVSSEVSSAPYFASMGFAKVFAASEPGGLARALDELLEPRVRDAFAERARAAAPSLTWDRALPAFEGPILAAARRHARAARVPGDGP